MIGFRWDFAKDLLVINNVLTVKININILLAVKFNY